MNHIDVWKTFYLKKPKGADVGICVLCHNRGGWRFKGKERPCLCPNGIAVARAMKKAKRTRSSRT
jgi:hypothetical protein